MKRLVVIAMAVALAMAFVIPAAGAARGNGADKAPLWAGWYTPSQSNCTDGAIAEDPNRPGTFGFVVMNINANGTLTGTIQLKGATPNNEYDVWITGEDSPWNCPGTPWLGHLTTDDDGHGTFKLVIDGVDPQGRVWVIVTDYSASPKERFQSPAVDLNYPTWAH